MSLTLHVIDAFADRPFAGNPAAVCLLPAPRDAAWMQLVAREMNLSETAFLQRTGDAFALRWFTPAVEVKLCGHATLASAHTLWETGLLKPDEPARFDTLSGRLTCRRVGDWIEMDFPAKVCAPCAPPAGLPEALGCDVLSVGGPVNGLPSGYGPIFSMTKPIQRKRSFSSMPCGGSKKPRSKNSRSTSRESRSCSATPSVRPPKKSPRFS